jgi:hypothetical protein
MALKSARSAGISVDMEAFVAAQDWLDKVSSPAQPGLYAYQPTDAPSPAMTAEGLLVQQILGRRVNEPRMRQSVAYLLEHLPYWDDSPNTYYWYYATMALFNRQGEPWRRWNEVLTEQLLDRQRKEGPAAGSWNPEGEWAETGGRVYQTALCTLMLEVYYRYLPLFLRERPADAIGTIRGTVTDAATGEPISGAVVRLELIAEEPIEVFSIANGTYTLHPPEVPTFFALSASSEGYLPTSKNVATAMVQGTTLDLDFALKPRAPDSVALEDEPQVHHLGDNAFEGRVNSQFQRESEGATFTAEFNLTAEQLTPETGLAELTMLVKGVQMRHRVLVNGHLIGPRLDWSPRDGSFGTIALQFDPALLQIGTNTLRIIASARGSDIDDFEFVNMQIRLLLRKMVRDL